MPKQMIDAPRSSVFNLEPESIVIVECDREVAGVHRCFACEARLEALFFAAKIFRERLHSYRNGYIEWSRVMDAQRDLIEEALAAPEI